MGTWSTLKFNAGSATAGLLANWNYRIRSGSSGLAYRNNRYKSVFVHIAKQLVMSTLENELREMLPRWIRKNERKLRDHVREQQERNYQKLIDNGNVQSEKWGQIKVDDGKNTIVAKDKYGTPVKEALIVYYEEETAHTYEEITYINGADHITQIQTKAVFHIDLSPSVSVSSSKNIVTTQVQGRDFTRKELVSGGDLEFTVNGKIVSNNDGMYPENDVKKFIQIMQYNGILDVKFFLFDQFNVRRIIIKNYSLGNLDYKNVQPYSFTCVAVEPDEDVQLVKDTISSINYALSTSSMNKWYKLLLEKKLARITASSIVGAASGAAVEGAGIGLDEILPNI